MIRYLDGCNPGPRYGYMSFFQILTWNSPIAIWSVVHITTNKSRAVYYLSGEITTSKIADFAIVLKMRSNRMNWEQAIVSVTHFNENENAPKKLNKAIRALRAQLFSDRRCN